MAAADGSIIIDVRANTQQATSALTKLAKLAATAFAVDKIIDFSKQAIQLGSDVAEVQNVVDVAFGDMSSAVDEFAQNAITNFGMSELAAKRTASTYMAMASNMGLSQAEAAEMSLTLTGLTGDVASFYNISQELADIKLKSVFTGETETLKDLGIVMTQANLEAFALSQGITKSISAMSQAELVTLRYNFVLDQLSLASGDFIRTQDSWANQTRILSMQWQQFMSIIGEALIQVLLPVVQTLNRIVSALIDMANAFNAAITAIFGGANTEITQTQDNVGGVSSGIGDAVDNQNALTDATKETNKEQKKSIASFDEINKLTGNSASGSGGGTGGAAGGGLSKIETITSDDIVESAAESKILKLIDRLKDAFSPLEDSFKKSFAYVSEGVEKLADVFRDMWNDIKSLGPPLYDWFNNEFMDFLNQFILTAGNVVGGLLDSAAMVLSDIWNIVIFPTLTKWAVDILPLLTNIATQVLSVGDVLFESVKAVFDMIWQDVIAPAMQIIQDIWSDCWDSIIDFWNTWGAPIFDQIKAAISNTTSVFVNIWNTILKPVLTTLGNTFTELWTLHLKPLLDNFLNFVGTLIEGALRIYNEFILPLVDWFVNTFGPPISEAFQAVIDIFGRVVGAIADGVSQILEWLTSVIGFVVNVFTIDWNEAWDGISEAFSNIWDGFVQTIKDALNIGISLVNKFIDWINEHLVIRIPKVTIPFLGTFGGQEIRPFTIPNIPYLAQGAVIPPNREFLAVLGDQKQGTNIEAPLSTIEKALENVMNRRGYGGQQTVILQLDREQLGKVVYELNKAETRRIGVNLAGV
jgi:phage-related protein|nr:MAG TPA: minor tail protein [Caudoviricetes sp.]